MGPKVGIKSVSSWKGELYEGESDGGIQRRRIGNYYYDYGT